MASGSVWLLERSGPSAEPACVEGPQPLWLSPPPARLASGKPSHSHPHHQPRFLKQVAESQKLEE